MKNCHSHDCHCSQSIFDLKEAKKQARQRIITQLFIFSRKLFTHVMLLSAHFIVVGGCGVEGRGLGELGGGVLVLEVEGRGEAGQQGPPPGAVGVVGQGAERLALGRLGAESEHTQAAM